MSEYDLVIRNGLILDGTGSEAFRGDVAVTQGRIAAVGKIDGAGAEEIDAGGMLVTPGFVDVHTHYDGQVTWEHRLDPSSGHGVTTVVMGNCGIGFAPCRPEDRDPLMRLMEGVEDLPEPVLAAGIPWEWETFPEYLDFLDARTFDIDVAAQLPHAALRVYAMGQRAIDREEATEADRELMARIAEEAVAAGAIGFTTSRSINHKSSDGTPVPTLTSAEEELVAIAQGVGRTGKGVLQAISDFDDPETDLAMLRRMAEAAGRPLSISLAQWEHVPERWRQLLGWVEQCSEEGLPVRAQVIGRPVGMMLGWELSFNPLCHTPTWQALAGLPLEERRKRLAEPETRAAILAEAPQREGFATYLGNYATMFALGDPPNYEPDPEDTIARRAERMGIGPDALAYDEMMANGGTGILMKPAVNYAYGSLDASYEMMRHKDTVYGLGDGGAHLGFMCDASQPTAMLAYWARDRKRGPTIPLPEVVRGLTRDPALAVGLEDRGMIAPGYKADLNVIDFEGITLHSPRVRYDLPTGGRRLTQDADGYVATVVSGVVTRRGGRPTGAQPGRLVRGGQPAPDTAQAGTASPVPA